MTGGPGWLVKLAGRAMPAERREWGEAMAAELSEVRGGRERWMFAAGCLRAAAGTGGMGGSMKRAILAAAAGAGLAAPFAYMESRFATMATFPYALFAFLWLMGTVFALGAAPVALWMRGGGGAAARPLGLAVRIGIAAVAAGLWVVVVNDQMPCFLGVPNCD